MKKFTIIILLTAVVSGACVFRTNRETTVSENKDGKAPVEQTPKTEKPAENKETAKTEKPAENKLDKSECLKIETSDDKKIDEKQTFAFDSEPFKGGCFVTVHDKEYDDPPLNSEFFIYQDGREVYKFPNQFNGVTTGCWVEGVAFEDLNEDDLKDIVIVGMCSAKSAPYNENMVYVNKGDEFRTSEEANYTLEKFKRVKDISDFVKKNQEQFFQ